MIETILTPNRTRAKISSASKKRVIEVLAQTFAHDQASFDEDSLYQNHINREKLGTTGIGGGIAIPHCRFATGGDTYGVCLTLETPINFDAVDNKPVDLIFAMLVPEDAEKNHLETLAHLAERLQNEGFVKNLRNAQTDEALFCAAAQS